MRGRRFRAPCGGKNRAETRERRGGRSASSEVADRGKRRKEVTLRGGEGKKSDVNPSSIQKGERAMEERGGKKIRTGLNLIPERLEV